MLQRIFLNGLLLSFLVGYTPGIKGWDMGLKSEDMASVATDAGEVLAYVAPLGFLGYLFYRSCNKYNSFLNERRVAEEIITKHGSTCPPHILNFVRLECERAGHSDPGKIMIHIESDEKDVETQNFSIFPSNAGALKTSKYDLIIFSLSEIRSLLELFRYKDDLALFRKNLFSARVDMDVTLEDESINNLKKYLNSIFFYVVNKQDVSDMQLSDTCFKDEHERYIEKLENELHKNPLYSEMRREQEKLIQDLKKIAYTSDEYLELCLDEILDMWSAVIHHEAGHLQQKISVPALELALNSLCPLIGYSVARALTADKSASKRLSAVLLGTSIGLLLSKFSCFTKKRRNEIVADAHIVLEEKYLKGGFMFFSYADAFEKQALKESWQEGFRPYFNHLFQRWTDVHPTDEIRARNCAYRYHLLRQREERKKRKNNEPQSNVSFLWVIFWLALLSS